LDVVIFGKKVRALLDSGCTRSIVSINLVQNSNLRSVSQRVVMMNGLEEVCSKSCKLEVVVEREVVQLDCLVAKILPGYQILLGMDMVRAMNGVTIRGDGSAMFVKSSMMCASAVGVEDIVIHDDDFSAVFSHGK
jgi:hypothetical protein